MKAVKKKISIFLMTLMLASTFSANVTKADVIESKNTFAYEEIMRKNNIVNRMGKLDKQWYSYMYSWSRMGN